MAHLISFDTAKFDLAAEPPNPINPIAGVSFLHWLREALGEGYAVSEPAAEDWGWYVDVVPERRDPARKLSFSDSWHYSS